MEPVLELLRELLRSELAMGILHLLVEVLSSLVGTVKIFSPSNLCLPTYSIHHYTFTLVPAGNRDDVYDADYILLFLAGDEGCIPPSGHI
jgi:hypothetical protein